MSDTVPAESPASARFAEHVHRLSPLQVKLLIGFLVLGLIGATGVAWTWMHPETATKRTVTTVHRPTGASGFAGDAPDETTTTTDVTAPTWSAWFSAHGAKLGFGFVGGFILGFIFRAFLKIMTLITIVVGGGLAALSYFHVLNIDFTAAQHAWSSNADWITTEATKLKDVVMAHLPSSTTGAAGLFVGLRRK